MINDARVGDEPAVVNDAQVGSDVPLPPGQPGPVGEAVGQPGAAVGAPQEDAEAASSDESEGGDESAEEQQADDDAEAQGRAAAEDGESRSANPYDGRRAEGKAWYRGYDSVKAEA